MGTLAPSAFDRVVEAVIPLSSWTGDAACLLDALSGCEMVKAGLVQAHHVREIRQTPCAWSALTSESML